MKILLSSILLSFCFLVKANNISVVSYNVNYSFINEGVVEILGNIDADVVCLQETNVSWEKILTKKLKNKYPFISFKHYGTAGGLAVLSKLPIVKSNYIKNSVGWFPAWMITVLNGRDSIQLLNTHLKPGLTPKGRIGWNAYFKAEEIHIQEIKNFMKFLNPVLPTIILGDFNENDNGKSIKWLSKEGFFDALPLYDKKMKTWRWVILKGRYDHLIFNRNITCSEAKVFKQGKSDHFPIYGEFDVTYNLVSK